MHDSWIDRPESDPLENPGCGAVFMGNGREVGHPWWRIVVRCSTQAQSVDSPTRRPTPMRRTILLALLLALPAHAKKPEAPAVPNIPSIEAAG